MIEVPRKYQACFFADTSKLRPSAETIPPLLQAFSDRNLLPSTGLELAFTTQSPVPKPEPRLRLASPDNEWVIAFETPRINIEKNPVKPLGANLGTVEEFTRDADLFLSRILERFPIKASRLAIITWGLLGEMTEDRLREAYARVLVPNAFYAQNTPVGWNSRSLTRVLRDIGGGLEQLNIITHVNRIQGEFHEEGGVVPFDRIEIELDINTYQGNTESRFEIGGVRAFFPEALKLRDSILAALKEQLSA